MKHFNISDIRILTLLEKVDILTRQGKNIVFAWIPGHVNIHGNDHADQMAKDSLFWGLPEHPIPHVDYKANVKQKILNQ